MIELPIEEANVWHDMSKVAWVGGKVVYADQAISILDPRNLADVDEQPSPCIPQLYGKTPVAEVLPVPGGAVFVCRAGWEQAYFETELVGFN